MINIKVFAQKISLLIFIFLLIPAFSLAQTTSDPIIPCDGVDCDYYDLLEMVNRIINWIILISIPVAAGVFAFAGLKYMTAADNSGQKSEAKSMINKTLIGFVFILSAWIIVSTVLNVLLDEDYKGVVPVEGVN